MKYGLLTAALVLVAGAVAFAATQGEQNKLYSWRFKMTVIVETPEGEILGSAVREMSNTLHGSPLSQQGNPASVKGEAVVVDLGERGVLFALISSDSDMEFYDAFRKIWPDGGAKPEAIKFYADLPIGTKTTLPVSSRYPKLVTFTDMSDPKSVALVYDLASCTRARKNRPEICDGRKGYFTKVDRFEELFGEGVKIKDITLEITDEPMTWGVVDEYLPAQLLNHFQEWWKNIPAKEKMEISQYLQFKQGER